MCGQQCGWVHIDESVGFLFFVSQGELHWGVHLSQHLEDCLLNELHVLWGTVVILARPATGNSSHYFMFLWRSLMASRRNIVWDMTTCSLVEIQWCARGPRCFQSFEWKSEPRWQQVLQTARRHTAHTHTNTCLVELQPIAG